MDMATNDSAPRAPAAPPVALGVLTLVVYFAGFATVAAWFALMVLGPPGSMPAAQRSPGASSPISSPLTCSVCGVVEQVEELAPGGLNITGDKGEGFVVLLALLSSTGDVRAPRTPLYETAVRHDDGSVRVVRDHNAPKWKRGDRVRVVKGRIEPGGAADIRTAPQEDAAADAPAKKIASPIPPVARGR